MEIQEFVATMEQIARERAALNAAYQGLEEQAIAEAEEVERTGVQKSQAELLPGLLELTTKLGNFVNFEREHGDKLYALLVDALRRLAQSYEIDLPADWPDGDPATGSA